MKKWLILVCGFVFVMTGIAGQQTAWAQCQWGDINCDDFIDNADVQVLTDCILGNGMCTNCDLNSDGLYNISDVQLLTNIIHTKQFCGGVTEISNPECKALMLLYHSTNGADWNTNTGWASTMTPCSWSGVTCNTGVVTGLDLSYNLLTGMIPVELGNLNSLQTLNLAGNQLSGTIPVELGSLSSLQVLNLAGNQLSGTIPVELGGLSSLQFLHLSNNQLIGTIPLELGNLAHSLIELDLSDNQLRGAVPSQLGNLGHLTRLHLKNNSQLSGSLPHNLVILGSLNGTGTLNEFFFDNTDLCEPGDAIFQNWLQLVTATGGSVQSTGITCQANEYYIANEYPGNPADADANALDPTDDNMCWAFAAANVLEWGGWEVTGANPDLSTAQNIFTNGYKPYWDNNGSWMQFAWNWWLDGTQPPGLPCFDPFFWSQIHTSGGGNHWPGYMFSQYYVTAWRSLVIEAIRDYLHSGYGVSILIYNNASTTDAIGHALTVWGYRYYDDGTVTALYVSDPADDFPTEYRWLPVTYQGNWLGGTLYGLKWRIANDAEAAPYQNWLIEGVQALKPRSPSFIRVRKAGTGSGTVVSSPSGINCGSNCVFIFSDGTNVALTPNPDSGSVFSGWQGAGCSDTGTCVVTVEGAMQVAAIFDSTETPTHIISAAQVTGVTIVPDIVQSVSTGGNATFHFIPDSGYKIVDVAIDGVSVGPVTTYTFRHVTEDHAIDIKTLSQETIFSVVVTKKCIDQFGEEMDCPPGENSTVLIGEQVCDSECMWIVDESPLNQDVILQVIPDPESEFVCWESQDGQCNLGDNTQPSIVLSSGCNVRPVTRCGMH